MEGELRLVGGSLDNEGRVEICIEETWSTICDNGWTVNDANVACQQLGYLERGISVLLSLLGSQESCPLALK